MFTKGKFTEIFILCVLNKSLTAFTTGNFSIGPVLAEVNFWRPGKTVNSCDLFILIIIIIIRFFRRVFSECTQADAASLYH